MKIRMFPLFAALVLALAACATGEDVPNTDTGYYPGRPYPTEDVALYTISGTVGGDIVSNQRTEGYGSIAGSAYGVYGSYYETTTGKGILRLLVTASDDPLAPVGKVVILKTTDLKVLGLVIGDEVTFMCRHDYEMVSPKQANEAPTLENGAIEIDYCKLAASEISATATPSGPR